MKRINIYENGIYLVFEVNDNNQIKLLHFSTLPLNESDLRAEYIKEGFNLVELQISGIDRPGERHGNKYIVTAPGYRLKFKKFNDYNNNFGRKLEIICIDELTAVEVTSNMQFFTGTSAVRCWTKVVNKGNNLQTLEYVSSFALSGIEKEGLIDQDKKLKLGVCSNSWQREVQWNFYTLYEVGLSLCQPEENQHSSKVFGVTNVGNWSAKEFIPMGYMENSEAGTALIWQIENNGSWNWEISDQEGHLYLRISGPSEIESHWCKNLAPNESFESAYCCVCAVNGGFDTAVAEITKYRRIIRRKNYDNKKLAVIFNDYMNCLWGDPTAEKEFPLIDSAAQVGCEYFCIDAGWYSDGPWWDGVGLWEESKKRFPEGLKKVTDYIKSKGMIPGVWLEIEVMGINCPLADKVSNDWFFVRHGKRVFDRSRYQLDFRNPQVREHCHGIIRKLVNDYGIEYIKMDYNIEPGIGTELNAHSYGEGLLEHERCYLKWLDEVFVEFPGLVIENCSSGGLRMDYAMLSRYSIQSTSDQDDYRKYCTIAANSPSAVCPEQSAVWSYPIIGCSREQTVFNMVNAMLLRIHQSGNLANIDNECKLLVKEGINVYKEIRDDIRESLPFWSLGLSKFSDEWVSLGLKCPEKKAFLAVWRRSGSEDICQLKIGFLKNKNVNITCIYPSYNEEKFFFNRNTGILSVKFTNNYMARLFRIDYI